MSRRDSRCRPCCYIAKLEEYFVSEALLNLNVVVQVIRRLKVLSDRITPQGAVVVHSVPLAELDWKGFTPAAIEPEGTVTLNTGFGTAGLPSTRWEHVSWAIV